MHSELESQTLAVSQARVDSWICAHGGYWGKFEILARMTEELGEVASALQRLEGLRPRKSDVDLAGEVGDLLFTLMAFANANGIDLASALEGVMQKYQARDSQAWQETHA